MDMAVTRTLHMRSEVLDLIQHNTLPILQYLGITSTMGKNGNNHEGFCIGFHSL